MTQQTVSKYSLVSCAAVICACGIGLILCLAAVWFSFSGFNGFGGLGGAGDAAVIDEGGEGRSL